MIPILMYHQVAEIPRRLDPLGLAVPPGQFERQMAYLASNAYRCLTVAEAARYVGDGRRPPARSFVLTFDDGYQDFRTNACPILERFGFTATVFLVAGRLGVASNWAGQDGERSGLLLSRAEAGELARRGHILGSHTFTHQRLTRLDDQLAMSEIQDSKVLLENQLAMPIDFFSYPYSDSDARVERLVRAAGYVGACGGDSRPWGLFNLWRAPCSIDDTPVSFILKANGWFHRLIAVRESAPGQSLRHYVRTLRRLLFGRGPRHPVITKTA